jgi:hypothetical protein
MLFHIMMAGKDSRVLRVHTELNVWRPRPDRKISKGRRKKCNNIEITSYSSG